MNRPDDNALMGPGADPVIRLLLHMKHAPTAHAQACARHPDLRASHVAAIDAAVDALLLQAEGTQTGHTDPPPTRGILRQVAHTLEDTIAGVVPEISLRECLQAVRRELDAPAGDPSTTET
jgi:hypothetical protein